jgi:hypothetical protein
MAFIVKKSARNSKKELPERTASLTCTPHEQALHCTASECDPLRRVFLSGAAPENMRIHKGDVSFRFANETN